MRLRPNFHFSQNNLQDFLDCPRRFELLHLLQLPWPAVQSEPVLEQERHMELGQRFHQLVHQHQLGVPVDIIQAGIGDSDLAVWWHEYLANSPRNLPEKRYPEWILSTPFAGYRLVAKYDLLAIEPGKQAFIVDWKTNRHRPKSHDLENRIQTRLYRYLLVQAGDHLYGVTPIKPEDVEMIYWFTASSQHPLSIAYTQLACEEDGAILQQLISEIHALCESPNPFPLTLDENKCKFCKYRTLCDRGILPGEMTDAGDEQEVDELQSFQLDFEQIGEIEF